MLCWLLLYFTVAVSAKLVFNDSTSSVSIQNDRLRALFSKSTNAFSKLSIDGIDLLGSGILYYDCHCIPSGTTVAAAYTPPADNVTVVNGTDTTGVAYVGVIASNVYRPTGQIFVKSWFIRDKETSIHHWTRAAYFNESVPNLLNFAELRSLFRPSSGIFTHLVSDANTWAPLPGAEAVQNEITVQDATWYLGNTTDDPYVQQESDYFTKYTFSNSWRNQIAHGMYGDGSTTNGTPFGAWTVMANKETYFGGPTHSDLLVDGIVYDYIISNHHGDGAPNVTTGFDRTFGPVLYQFNSKQGASLHDLLSDAESQATPGLHDQFYDDISGFVPGYVPSNKRGSLKALVRLPPGAIDPIAILAKNGIDYQDNANFPDTLQYWGEIDEQSGLVEIPRVKAGSYRLTIYATGIFGDYIQDNIKIEVGKETVLQVNWTEESHGKELWRIGTPDKSSGEFRHGNFPTSSPLHPAEYRIYWGAYDFPTDFPHGINFTIGQSNEATDLNYIHWSVFGPTFNRPNPVFGNLSNWTINFELAEDLNLQSGTATLQVQLAGVKTASGNTDVPNGDWSNVPLTYYFNSNPGLVYTVPYWHSSSCGVRSAVQCYQVAFTLSFPANWLHHGWNILILSLPHNATDTESSVLPGTIYVQYDALRLELA